MKNDIEDTLKQSGLTEEQSQIADLSFSFNNYNMLELLSYRAERLYSAKFNSVTQLEKKITREKDRDFESIV